MLVINRFNIAIKLLRFDTCVGFPIAVTIIMGISASTKSKFSSFFFSEI
jgi:hypothetical protein